jgi:uncharacterized membrane-anchored protein YitT (DUF2179 family)
MTDVCGQKQGTSHLRLYPTHVTRSGPYMWHVKTLFLNIPVLYNSFLTLKMETKIITLTLITNNNNHSVALVHERTKLTERPPLVGEVSANYCG